MADQELEHFKSGIDLRAYAAGLGYVWNRKENLKGGVGKPPALLRGSDATSPTSLLVLSSWWALWKSLKAIHNVPLYPLNGNEFRTR
jgi:hypothetical protein